MNYNWQQKDWPEFRFSLQNEDETFLAFAEETGHVSGMLKVMPESIQMETIINLMVSEAINTSEIEGEYLSREDVMSSIRNNLGLNKNEEKVKDKGAQGIGELMVAVRKTYSSPLTDKVLFSWHKMLMKGSSKIKTAVWRSHKEPMQVISGSIGKEKIHFEAPPSSRVPTEMKKFIKWFNDTAPGGKKEIKKSPVRAAIAHLYFESIHPFEDGNGRIGRAIAEKALSQTIGRPVLLSLSQTIEANRKLYYEALQKAQKSNEITDWINYFISIVLDSQMQTKKLIDLTLQKAKFYDRFKNELNERQLKAIKKMLDKGPVGFVGGMTTKKYISITKASKATATRDIQVLVDLGIFIMQGGGRSTSYIINLK